MTDKNSIKETKSVGEMRLSLEKILTHTVDCSFHIRKSIGRMQKACTIVPSYSVREAIIIQSRIELIVTG